MQETILFSAPRGFRTFVTNLGIRDTTDDFSCIVSEVKCTAAGVFTQSRFVGPSVTISRKHIENGQAQAIVTISKNANVANGAAGLADAQEVIALISAETGIAIGNFSLPPIAQQLEEQREWKGVIFLCDQEQLLGQCKTKGQLFASDRFQSRLIENNKPNRRAEVRVP